MDSQTPDQPPKRPRFALPTWLPAMLFVVGIVAGTTTLANMYLMRAVHAPSGVVCAQRGVSHWVIIENGAVDVPKTDAKLCDTLTIMNRDVELRDVAFGPHDEHITYDGITEKLLAQGQSFTVVLNQPGTFTFHDHEDATIGGTFTVSLH